MIDDIQLLESNLNFLREEELNKFLASDQRLVFEKHPKPLISVVIPTFNKAHLTLACLQSLKSQFTLPHEVIIFDNCSTDSTRDLLTRIDNITSVLSDKNVFFAQACNLGVAKAKGEYILLLNNDIQVMPDFDTEMVQTFQNFKQVGAVGGQLIHPDGKLQEAGCMIWNDGTPWAYGRDQHPYDWQTYFTREVDYCSAALLMVPTALYRDLGGISREYEPFYFEDTDFQMQLREHGYRVMYNPFVKAVHHEHGSIGQRRAIEYMAQNKKVFFKKWESVLQRGHYHPSRSFLRSRSRSQGMNILIVDNRVPVPEHGGGYPRAYKIISHLLKTPHQITLFPLKKDEVDTSAWNERTKELQRKGLEIVQGDISFDQFARSRATTYDVVFVSRGNAFDRVLVDIKRLMPTARVIFDSEAVDFLRNEAKMDFLNRKKSVEERNQELSNELFRYRVADKVAFISKRDQDFVIRHEPSVASKSVILGHPLDPEFGSSNFEDRNGFLFLGGFLGNSGLNEHAILYFIKNVWPQVFQSCKSTLKIAGSNMPEEVRAIRGAGIETLGYVENLHALYNEVRVFVVPHQFAGGIPWKLSEALSCGVPAVVSRLVAEQMGLKEGQGVLIANSENEFQEKCIKIYSDKKIWNELRDSAKTYIAETHSSEVWTQTLNKIFEIDFE